jgi:hypothetical protein
MTKATTADVSAALENIQRFAKFIPRAKSTEAEWWMSFFSKR